MTEQEQKAVEEYAKKASQIDTLIISNSLNESIKAYNEGVHNGILMGAQFLDNYKKRKQMKNHPKRIYLQIGNDCPSDADFSGLSGVSWCNEKIHSNDIEYIRIDLVVKFALQFMEQSIRARVDEYIGARKNVCVNDLFEEFLKTKEDEKP